MKARPGRDGFVLVMVLVILMIAAVILAALARRNSDLVLQAASAQERLELRWGDMSCRAVFEPMAEHLLAKAESDEQAPHASASRSLDLGGMRVHVLVGDEQAKANVGTLLKRRGQDELIPCLEALQEDLRQNLKVQLRPMKVSTAAGGVDRYVSYGQVFVFDHPSELINLRQDEELPTDRITCWGDGKVSVRSAPPCVLREVLGTMITEEQIAQIVKLRGEKPQAGVSELIAALKLPPEKSRAMEQALTDQSLCQSLWIVWETGGRRYYRLYVSRAGGSSDGPGPAFEW